MDGYQSDCDFSKSVPSLKVIAPTPQLSNARHSTALRLPKRDLGLKKNASTNPTPISPFTDVSSIKVDFESDDNLEDLPPVALLLGMPSWLVSMAVHLSILLTMAFCTFGSGGGDRSLMLEVVESTSDPEVISLDIVVDDVEIVDAFEELEPTEEFETELQSFASPEMIQEFSKLEDPNLALVGLESRTAGDSKVTNTGSNQKGKGAEFFGATSYGSRFVFVIDCSGSMQGSRWRRAVKELIYAVDALENDQEFLVLLYNTGTRVMLDKDTREAALIAATSDHKGHFRGWIRAQSTQGGTYPAQSMYLALTLEPDAIYLLSDGELQDQTVRMLRFWNIPKNRKNGDYAQIPIHTISLGGGKGKVTMMTIATQNSGTFNSFR